MNIFNKIFAILAIAMTIAFIVGEADAHRRRESRWAGHRGRECPSSEENTTVSYTCRWSGQVKNCTCLKVDGEEDRYTLRNCSVIGSSNSSRGWQWRGGHGRKQCSSAEENETKTFTFRRSGITKTCTCQQDWENSERWTWSCEVVAQQGTVNSLDEALEPQIPIIF